jgi:hypothetical protein
MMSVKLIRQSRGIRKHPPPLAEHLGRLNASLQQATIRSKEVVVAFIYLRLCDELEYQIGFVRSQIAPSSGLLANNLG